MTVSSHDLSNFLDQYRQLERFTVSAEALQHFFVSLRALRSERDTTQVTILANLMPEFRKGLDAAKKSAMTTELTYAPEFNVFRILRVSDNEAAHSDFLATMLDPSGVHGQGYGFLLAFLKLIKKYGGLPNLQLSTVEPMLQDAVVSREATIVAGRCDLVIALAGKFLLVIENKIRSSEGDQQLQRYARWLEMQERLYPNRALVFLTPHGDYSEAVEASLHTPLSYRPAIETWLRECSERCRPEHLQSVLDHYIAVLPYARGN